MQVGIASDHAGLELKEYLKKTIESRDIQFIDYGTFSQDSCDYPDFVHPLSRDLCSDLIDKGIIICGSGNGVAMTANKHSCIRAALCWSPQIAKLARNHNDANVIALPARFIDKEMATTILDVFFKEPFENGRHQGRVDKIPISIKSE
jgi:ribose 5-phosphate isomerase B